MKLTKRGQKMHVSRFLLNSSS